MAGSVDDTALREQLRTYALDRAERLGENFVAGLQSRCSRRSGELADSCGYEVVDSGGDVIRLRVFAAAPYARYQNEGTGLYGPNGGRIYPVTAKALAFDSAAGGFTIVRSTAGSPGTHFWDDTVADWPNIVAAS